MDFPICCGFIQKFDFSNQLCYYLNIMRNYHFSIIIEQDKDGYFVFCPELQGCYSQGDTYEEALANIKDAIKLHLEDRIQNREELPEERFVSLSTVEVAV